MQFKTEKPKLINIKEAMETPPNVFFKMPPTPPAQVQHVEPASSVTPNSSFKDFYHSNIPSFNADPSFILKATDYIRKNEGVRNKLYKDSKGLWTIGIGHLVTPEEIQFFKGKTLTNDQIEALFKKDVARKMSLIQRYFGSTFDSFPEAVKIAVLDGYFRGDLPGSPETQRLLKAGKFKLAAIEYLDHEEYREALLTGSGVAARMQRNAKLYRSAEKP